MTDLLNNPWVVGIGGGILSGLAVTYFTKSWLTKRDEKEFKQKVNAANQEILYAIRPCISESLLPTRKVIVRLIAATARKYELERKDLLTSLQVLQSLTKEVMDSSFISAKDKHKYCEMLSELIDPPKSTGSEAKKDSKPEEPEVIADNLLSDYKSRLLTMVSMMLGIIVSLTTVMVFYFQRSSVSGIGESLVSRLLYYISPGMISIAVVAVISLLSKSFNSLKAKESKPLKPSITIEANPEKKEDSGQPNP